MEPDVIRGRDGIQLSYCFPDHLNDASVYPRKPINGSTIVICAHNSGLRVVWLGGRKPKQTQPSRTNGNSIDLTDEDEDELDYEEEEEEVDPSRPFRKVLKYIDIDLGTAVTKIAVPPLSSEPGSEFHRLLTTHAVVLAACADLSLRLTTIPLEPGSKHTEETEQKIIAGSNSHQDLVSDVAITIAPVTIDSDDSGRSKTRSSSRGRDLNEATQAIEDIKDWSFLIASTSATGSGLLLIHQIPIDNDGRLSNSPEDLVPMHRKFLKSPLASCHLEFNPSLYPSHRYSHLLIASSDGAATKIYQALPQANAAKKRRGSTATIDSTTSASHSRKNTATDKVLLNLMHPFHRMGEQDLFPRRKRALDAKWVLQGRAVLTLLEDGEWGVWDIEAAGPTSSSSSSNLVQGQSNVSGIQGGSLAKFAIKGHVSQGNMTKKSTSNKNHVTTDSSFMPMTPHTRKTRSQGLFKGQDLAETEPVRPLRFAFGSLDVSINTSIKAGTKTRDESVIINYEHNNYLITSLQSCWRSENGARGSFEGTASTRPSPLPRLRTANEEQKRVCLIPWAHQQSNNDTVVSSKPSQDFLVVTASRLIILATPLLEPTDLGQTSSMPPRFLTGSSVSHEQLLLDSGELDVDGMDRMLDQMAQSNHAETNGNAPVNFVGRKSVGFQLDDEDQDMDMGTPTVPKSSRGQLVVSNKPYAPDGRRRLFT